VPTEAQTGRKRGFQGPTVVLHSSMYNYC